MKLRLWDYQRKRMGRGRMDRADGFWRGLLGFGSGGAGFGDCVITLVMLQCYVYYYLLMICAEAAFIDRDIDLG